MPGFSSAVLWRGVSSLSRHQPRQVKFKSALLIPLNNSGKITDNHPLDTNRAEYYRVVNEIVLPDCMEVANGVQGFPERIKNLISYTFPAFSDCWNFGVELLYRLVSPLEEQTEENLTKMRILRACMDLTFTMSAVVDDLADDSLTRKQKPAWCRICEGGQWAGMYDGMVLGYLPFYLLKKNFHDHPGYRRMMEAFTWGNMQMLVGEIADMCGHRSIPDPDLQSSIVSYKAGHFVAIQPVLALLLAGIMDEKIIQQTMELFRHLGMLIQTWDDFNDYYSSEMATGKPSCDFQNAGTTWVSTTAFKHFNSRQKKIFQECYGSGRPEDVEAVKRLYDEVDIPRLYVGYLRDSWLRLEELMAAINEPRVRLACANQLQWLLGDVCRPLPEFGIGPIGHSRL